jgi:hypothetical protein
MAKPEPVQRAGAKQTPFASPNPEPNVVQGQTTSEHKHLYNKALRRECYTLKEQQK